MKKITAIYFLIIFLGALSMQAQTPFWSDTFEDTGAPSSGSRNAPSAFTNTAPSNSHFNRLNNSSISNNAGAYASLEGSKFWAGEDTDNGQPVTVANVLKTVTWTINISGKSNISLKGLFAVGNNNTNVYDNGTASSTGVFDYMSMQYSIDGGPIQNLISFYPLANSNSALFPDLNFDGNGDPSSIALTNTFTEHTGSVIGTGTTLTLYMNMSMSGAAEEVAIDNLRLVEIVTCVNPSITAQPASTIVCNTANTAFNISSTGATSWQWQVNSGAGFTNISNVAPYSGATTQTLNITGATTSLNGYLYRCIATDATCNTTSGQANLTVSNPSLTAASQFNISCFGGNNGSAIVNPATGGVSPYTYNWTPGNPTGDGTVSVSGLTAGTWTCTATDANSCTATRTFNITQPSAINLSAASQTNISCNGGNNGAASINLPTGGAGGFAYNWTPGNPSGDGTVSVSGLIAGTWTCTVTDANSCTKTQTFNITQPSVISLSAASQTNISCNGGSNGAASVVPASGGAGSFTYNWTPGNPTGDGTVNVSGLAAGTWTCTATDANSCTATQTFNITQPTALIAFVASQTNISCNGGSNGAASVNVNGGTTAYSYNWTPGNPTGDGTASVTGLAAGTWTCTITDANTCSTTQTFNLTQPAAINLSPASQTNIACNSGNTGAASINTPTGGAGGFTYNWTPGNPTGDGTVSVTGLIAGTWTCTVTDANSCTNTQTFNITQPTAINLSAASQTNISCNGGNNGAASINTPTGGAGGFTYNWTPGNPTGDGTVSVSGLVAGTWTCTVTDANACSTTQTFNITQPTTLIASAASQTNIACNGGSNGAAIINTPTGGAGGYTYNWTPGNPTGDGTTSVSGLIAGTWTCTVTDANTCSTTQTFNITQPTALVATAGTVTNVSCNGASTGSATVNVSGGTTNYSYAWSPSGGNAVTASGLNAGSYTCTVTDANSCSTTQTFNITQPAAINASISSTLTSCTSNTGTASVTGISGGTGSYSYNWLPSGGTAATATGLGSGSYTCTITDANNCSVGFTTSVSAASAPTVTALSQTNILCNSASTGAASVNLPIGGVGPFTYNWTPGNPNGDGTASVTGLTAGTWVCTVTDANNCDAVVSFTITEPNLLVATLNTQTNVSCNGSANGSASIAVTGGTGAYTYAWSPSGGNAATASGLSAGTYTCTITDTNACIDTATVSITEPSLLTAIGSSTVSSCTNNTGTASVTSVVGGTGSYTYSWSPSGGTASNATGLGAGTYTCTITDANACSINVNVLVGTASGPSISVAAQSNVSCNGGSNGSASITNPIGGTPPFTYSWSPGNPIGDSTTNVSGLSSGTWFCTVKDSNDCSALISFNITQPNAITSSQIIILCAGQTLTVGTSVYNTTGIFTDTLLAINGCDSIVTTDLTIRLPVNITTTLSATTINAIATPAIYQWIDCTTNLPIASATNQSFTALTNGNYAVIINQFGCIDTSACVSVSVSNIVKAINNSANTIIIQPNPSQGAFSIKAANNVELIKITDIFGKVIQVLRPTSLEIAIDMRGQANGMYFVNVITDGKQRIFKVMKE